VSLTVLHGRHLLLEELLLVVQYPVTVIYGLKDTGHGDTEAINGLTDTGQKKEEGKGGSPVIGSKEVPDGNGYRDIGGNCYIFFIRT